jgi:hypothetical protein
MLIFCLSRLLMAKLYMRQDATRTFVRRFVRARFARIFPLFAAVVIGSAWGTAARSRDSARRAGCSIHRYARCEAARSVRFQMLGISEPRFSLPPVRYLQTDIN